MIDQARGYNIPKRKCRSNIVIPFSRDGISMYRTSRKQSRQASRAARELAALNRDPYIHQTLIPRTQRIDNKQCQPWKPDEFAAILIDKLENVKREQDAQDKLDRKLMEVRLYSTNAREIILLIVFEFQNECGVPDTATHINEEQSKTLADAIRLKLHIVDDDDQDILGNFLISYLLREYDIR